MLRSVSISFCYPMEEQNNRFFDSTFTFRRASRNTPLPASGGGGERLLSGGMQLAAVADLPYVAGADDEVAEALARQALRRVMAEDRRQRLQDFGFADVFPVQDVQPVAREAAAQVQVVLARRLAGEGYLRQRRPCAAVGAAAHADDDFLFAQAGLVEQHFQFVQQHRQIPL